MRKAARTKSHKGVHGGAGRVVVAAALVVLLLALSGLNRPARAINIDLAGGGAGEMSSLAPDKQSSPEFVFAVPEGDFSLRISYLPGPEDAFREGIFLGEAAKIRGFSLAQAGLLARPRLSLTGKGSMVADYKPSASLQMKFLYEQDLNPGSGEGGRELSKTNLGYELTYKPSSSSQIRGAWKWLRREWEPGTGKAPTSSQSAEIGYELKLPAGLLRVDKKMLMNSAGEASRGEDTTSAHLEWKAGERLSLAADYVNKNRPQGTERMSTLTGKAVLLPEVNLGFKFLRQQAPGGADLARTDLSLDASLGKGKIPLQLTARATHLSQGQEEGRLAEMGVKGGLEKQGLKLKFSGLVKNQQGSIDGKPAGRLRSLNLEAGAGRLKVSGGREVFSPENGEVRQKDRLEAKASMSSETEAFWLWQRDMADSRVGREELGLSQRLRNGEARVTREERQGPEGRQQWDTVRMLWKSGGDLPEWAKSMGAEGLFEESPRYGFRPTPSWGAMTGPGLEASLRRRSGPAAQEDGSLRFIYRGLVGGLHFRAGHEVNPWTEKEGKEQVSLGKREFVEIGAPLTDKFSGLVRLSRSEGTSGNRKGIFLSLGGSISGTERMEYFFGSEPGPGAQDGGPATTGSTQGVVYSRKQSEDHYLNLKASINPPVQADKPAARWRIDLSFSQPF